MVNMGKFKAPLHFLLKDKKNEMLNQEQQVQVIQDLDDVEDLVGSSQRRFYH
jgi:hypothetical protein